MPTNERTSLERVAAYFEQVRLCRNCDLCMKEGHLQKAYDRCLVMFADQLPLPVVFIGEGPGFCEERTGEPFTGFYELIESRCGVCEQLGKCHTYFLHRSDTYKADETPCPFAPGDEPARLKDPKIFTARVKAIPPDMLYAKDANGDILVENGRKVEDPRTAGTLFDHLLASAGFVRPSAAQYWRDKVRLGLADPRECVPNCAVGNAVNCRPWEWKETSRGQIKMNAQPTDEERSACGMNLYSFLHLVRPKIVVACGSVGLSSLIGLKPLLSTTGTLTGVEPLATPLPTLESVHGKELVCSLVPDLGYELHVIPIRHPAAHMRLLKGKSDETPEAAEQRKRAYREGVARDLTVLKRVFADYVG